MPPIVGEVVSAKELSSIMGKNDAWPFTGEEDGWVKSHDAIRLDMSDFAKALATCVELLEAGKALQPWMVLNIQKWWPYFEKRTHEHHMHEEDIVFPEVNKIVVMPEKHTTDHKGLIQALTDIAAMIKALPNKQVVADDLVAFKALQTKYTQFHADMVEHLKEEEEIGLPLVRKYFTMTTFEPILKNLIKTMTPEEVGWFLRPMKDDETRLNWMKNTTMPGFVKKYIMLPACKKYRNNVASLILDVAAGERLPREPTGCFGC